MSQHWRKCAITGMALWALAASGCYLVTSPSEYEPAPGTEQPDATQPASEQPDARPPSSGQPDAGQLYPPGVADQPVILDCAKPSMRRVPEVSRPVVHLMGLFRPSPNMNGVVDVDFALPGENVLVLSAHDTVTWNVSLVPGGELTRLIFIGVNEPVIGAIPRDLNDVEILEPENLEILGCGYRLPPMDTQCDTEALISALEIYLGYPVASYDGCYEASQITFMRRQSQ